jgi:hypothetical protein
MRPNLSHRLRLWGIHRRRAISVIFKITAQSKQSHNWRKFAQCGHPDPAEEKNGAETRVARFVLVRNTKTGKNVPNEHKLYRNGNKKSQISVNIPNGQKIYQHFLISGPQKFKQIGIFGLKINHLATPAETRVNSFVMFWPEKPSRDVHDDDDVNSPKAVAVSVVHNRLSCQDSDR